MLGTKIERCKGLETVGPKAQRCTLLDKMRNGNVRSALNIRVLAVIQNELDRLCPAHVTDGTNTEDNNRGHPSWKKRLRWWSSEQREMPKHGKQKTTGIW